MGVGLSVPTGSPPCTNEDTEARAVKPQSRPSHGLQAVESEPGAPPVTGSGDPVLSPHMPRLCIRNPRPANCPQAFTIRGLFSQCVVWDKR